MFAVRGGVDRGHRDPRDPRHPHAGKCGGRLDKMRTYIDTHRDSVINWAYLIGGLWLAVRGTIELASN